MSIKYQLTGFYIYSKEKARILLSSTIISFIRYILGVLGIHVVKKAVV